MSKFEITIPGTQFVLKSDTLYQIQPKPDASAPDGFRQHGTTKVIHPDIGDTVPVPYDQNMGVWDTGFYTSSPVLRGMKPDERKAFVDTVQEYIVKPVEAIQGEGKLRHTSDNDYFDDFGVYLTAKNIFNTADPMQRLQLYFAVLGKNLAPKEHSSNPTYSKANFIVVNNEEAVGIRQEREMEKNNAIGMFFTLSSNNKAKLHSILKYLDITHSEYTDIATLNSIFTRWLENKQQGYQNSKKFIETYKKFEGEKGKDELYVFEMLNELFNKDKIVIQRGEVLLDGKVIGVNLKDAASNTVSNSEDLKKITTLYQGTQEIV